PRGSFDMGLKLRLILITSFASLFVVTACSRGPAQAETSAAAEPASTAGAGAPLETREPNGVDFKPAFEGQTRAPGLKSDVTLDVTVVAEGLEIPWAFEFLPDNRILVTERPGNLRIIGLDGKISAPAKGLPKVDFGSQGGLLD